MDSSNNSNNLSQSTVPTTTQTPLSANTDNSVSFQKKTKAPLLVVIIAWIMLLSGIFSLLGILPFLLFGGLAKVGILFLMGILNLIRGTGLIAVSFGIRFMRKWALYVFTVITIIAFIISIYTFITSPKHELTEFLDAGIQALITLYFWSIRKKFV